MAPVSVRCDVIYRGPYYVCFWDVYDNGDKVYRYSDPYRVMHPTDPIGAYRYGTEKLWITKSEAMAHEQRKGSAPAQEARGTEAAPQGEQEEAAQHPSP